MPNLKLAVSNAVSTSRPRAIRCGVTVGSVTHVERDSPNPQVIATLEKMLERARAGRTAGMIAAFIDPEGECTYMLSGVALDSPAIASEVTDMLKARFG